MTSCFQENYTVKKLNMKIATLILVMFFLTSCFSTKKATTDKTNDTDYIAQYISEIESQDKISNSPLIVIDGFAIDYADYKEESHHLSKSNIKQIDFLSKDSKTAINIYGERARGGVLLITTKNIQEKSAKTIDDSKVLFLLGDKQITQEELEKLDPNDIESIDVIKNTDDIKKYTKEDYDGVVIINMKK
jgi:hypothetical protein